jgi:hypothetical protein
MAFRRDRSDESYELEGEIENQTAKAWLINFTNVDKQVWVPKSQAEMLDLNESTGKCTIRVRGWFAEKENLA